MARYEQYAMLVSFSLGIFVQNLAFPIFGPYNWQAPPMFRGIVRLGDRLIGELSIFHRCPARASLLRIPEISRRVRLSRLLQVSHER
jgi:hypothetical protein